MLMVPVAQMQGPSPLKLGDYYQGGYIAYLTGSFPNQTGFVTSYEWVAMPTPYSLGYKWGLSGDNIAGASGSAIGTGQINTQYITSYYNNDPQWAATQATLYNGGGYTDWFLPSKDEFEQICATFNAGAFGGNSYWGGLRYSWTSTQTTSTSRAWSYDVRDGVIGCSGGNSTWSKNTQMYVRPIRYITYDKNNSYENIGWYY